MSQLNYSDSAPTQAVAGPPSILTVDDDPAIRRLLERYLSQEGFQVRSANDGPHMFQSLQQQLADLVILDLGLPGDNGLTLARQLSERYDVAIIILTGRAEATEKIVGLEMGADDYITKPFDQRELLARVRSVLRRTRFSPGEAVGEEEPTVAHFSDWHLDTRSRELFAPDGTLVYLTNHEYQLLEAFIYNPNRILSRDRVLDLVAQREHSPFDRSVDVLVGKLRKKLNEDPRCPTMIKTIRAAGYMFVPRVTLRCAAGISAVEGSKHPATNHPVDSPIAPAPPAPLQGK